MSLRTLIVLILSLPGLLLPGSTRVFVCLCASPEAVAGVDACANMPCCTPRDSDAVGEQQWHASDVCGGCKAIETPTAPSLEAPQAIELAWFAPRRIGPASAIDVACPASNPFERGARTNATGPPGDTGSIPLRL